jgi:hypothetical protein
MNFKTRIAGLLWADLRASELVAALLAVFVGVIFFKLHFIHPDNISTYILALENVMPLSIWGGAFLAYAAARLVTALGYKPQLLRPVIALAGMMLWASLFAAGTILQVAPAGLAVLYCVPAAFEIWVLAQYLAGGRDV